MLSKTPLSLRKSPPSRFCCLRDRFSMDFREPGTSKTMLKPKENNEFRIFCVFASDTSSEREKAPQSLPETLPRHPKSLPRAPLELPREPKGLPETSPRHP